MNADGEVGGALVERAALAPAASVLAAAAGEVARVRVAGAQRGGLPPGQEDAIAVVAVQNDLDVVARLLQLDEAVGERQDGDGARRHLAAGAGADVAIAAAGAIAGVVVAAHLLALLPPLLFLFLLFLFLLLFLLLLFLLGVLAAARADGDVELVVVVLGVLEHGLLVHVRDQAWCVCCVCVCVCQN